MCFKAKVSLLPEPDPTRTGEGRRNGLQALTPISSVWAGNLQYGYRSDLRTALSASRKGNAEVFGLALLSRDGEEALISVGATVVRIHPLFLVPNWAGSSERLRGREGPGEQTRGSCSAFSIKSWLFHRPHSYRKKTDSFPCRYFFKSGGN